MPAGNTRSTFHVPPHPPYIASGLGCFLLDVDGHETIDLVGNYTVQIHGHRHPAIVRAAKAAIDDATMCVGLPTEQAVGLAEHLTRRVAGLDRVRFCNSGTEAVMMLIRGARAFTGRNKILHLEGAYHGTYDAVVPTGAPGASPGLQAETIVVPPYDTEALRLALDRHGDELACVLLDCMPNRAGLTPLDGEFVRIAVEGARAHGALLAVDEVITLRCEWPGLFSRYGERPDLVAMGKIIGGGFPVGAFGGREDVMAVFDPSRADGVAHAGTFTGNPVTMAAGLVAMELLTQDEVARISALGDRAPARARRAGLARERIRITRSPG